MKINNFKSKPKHITPTRQLRLRNNLTHPFIQAMIAGLGAGPRGVGGGGALQAEGLNWAAQAVSLG